MPEPVVTAVVPCFNQGHFLADCIGSLRAQTLPNWRAIVINDCSTDGTTAALCDAQADALVTVVHLPHNLGRSGARNHGIALATTEAILSLDADDALHPQHLATTVPALLAAPTIGIAYTDYTLFGAQQGIWRSKPFDIKRLYREQYIYAGSMFRKSAWAGTHGYSDDFAIGNEDWDFWLTLVESGWLGVHVPQALFRYRIHAQSWTSRIDMHGQDRAYRSCLLLLEHHRQGFERHGAERTFLAGATGREAQRLHASGQREQARALWRQVANLTPWDVVAHLRSWL